VDVACVRASLAHSLACSFARHPHGEIGVTRALSSWPASSAGASQYASWPGVLEMILARCLDLALVP